MDEPNPDIQPILDALERIEELLKRLVEIEEHDHKPANGDNWAMPR